MPIRCEACGEEVRRIPEVGDAWLDAGIVPFSTLGWQNPTWIEHGYATGAARGLTGADLPDHAYWEQWFPADWVSEMREQIRLWFYSIGFMSMTLVGRLPYRAVLTYERVHAEDGSPMHKSTGNMIEANEAFDTIGADLMRWLYCATPPYSNVNFGYGLAGEVRRRLLTLWSTAGFLITYANIADWQPHWDAPPESTHALDRWLVARTAQLASEAEEAYERFWTPSVTAAFDSFVEDLSNWYVRTSRRRFWDGDPEALTALWWALQNALRVVAPVMPFLADHLWRTLVAEVCPDAPDSVHLAGWPEGLEPDETLLADQAEVRRVVDLGRQARGKAGIKVQQPLRRVAVRASEAAMAYREVILDELNVEKLISQLPANRVTLKPHLPLLGPRLGPDLPRVRVKLASGDFQLPPDGTVVVDELVLQPDEVFGLERESVSGDWVFADELHGTVVALDITLDEDLLRKGQARELIRRVNQMRKEAGLAITDRIRLTLPISDGDLVPEHGDWIKRETLAVELRVDGAALEIEKV